MSNTADKSDIVKDILKWIDSIPLDVSLLISNPALDNPSDRIAPEPAPSEDPAD